METETEKKLNYLLQRKRFSELTPEERAFVLSIISEERFDSYRILLGEEEVSPSLTIEELTLSSEVKDTVLSAFKNKHKKEKKGPIILAEFFRRRQPWISVPIAFGALALIVMLVVNLNQNKEPLTAEDSLVSEVNELKEKDSVKITELEPSLPEDPTVIVENEVHPKPTPELDPKEQANPQVIRKNPQVVLASNSSNSLEISKEDMGKYIMYSQAGLNERLIVPDMVEFEDRENLLMPEMYDNLGL